jgi:NHLM bacteriocin system ABC transporter ATP-binding protein
MAWFDEQIKQRIQNDEEGFSDAFVNLSSVIMGKGVIASLNDSRQKANNAIEEVLKFYHIKPTEIPSYVKDMNDVLEYQLLPHGIMKRVVKLEGEWYKDCTGILLGNTMEGDPVALIPKGSSGYEFFDYKSGRKIKLSKKTKHLIGDEALCFYNPLPLKQLGIMDLIKYMTGVLSLTDIIMVLTSTLALTGIGFFMPYINNLIFQRMIPSGKVSLVIPITFLLLGVNISQTLITITKTLIMTRIQTKLDIAVQSATMARILSLPASFFKNFSSGELSSRSQNINTLCSQLVNVVLTTGITSLFSLAYISQIANYAPALLVPALIIIGISISFSLFSTLLTMKISKQKMEVGAKLSGLVFALFSGIQKIKLAGAERRVFSKWANLYQKSAALEYNPPMLIKLSSAITATISLAGTIIIYYFAAISKVSIGDYMAFNIAYGMTAGAFMSLSGIAITVAGIKPVLDMALPILQAVPEMSVGKKTVTKVSGSIELSNVSFAYDENSPMIIDNLSLKIRAGQYVAIVGKTGCGKSTLMRLLLGFEKPQKGAIYYDGKDLEKLDLKSLRKNMGVVTQNGKLFTSDIFSNIIISAPWLGMNDAWEAAELAGIADDIRAMPMGMHTVISEGSGGISGGQRQRLMIARAIAPKPKIMMLDEATSALDNITQKQVSSSLDGLKSTRIVIAHRLSTIKHCDRIIVLDKGKIIEDGKFDDLITEKGYFAELVERQILGTV